MTGRSTSFTRLMLSHSEICGPFSHLLKLKILEQQVRNEPSKPGIFELQSFNFLFYVVSLHPFNPSGHSCAVKLRTPWSGLR